MTELIKFYNNEPNVSGFTHKQVVQFDDAMWETCHNSIQWVFANREPSQYNLNAPLLTDEDVTSFKRDTVIWMRAFDSFDRFVTFLGIDQREFYSMLKPGVVDPIISKIDFENRVILPNHNWLRITRCIKFFVEIGEIELAKSFKDFCSSQHKKYRAAMSTCNAFWNSALENS